MKKQPLSATESKRLRRPGKARPEPGPLDYVAIQKACDRFFLKRGLPLNEKFNPFEPRRRSCCDLILTPPMPALQLDHTDQDLIFRHYRELVMPDQAAKWWGIRPATQTKLVAISA